MRLFISVMLLMVVPTTLREMAVPAAASESSEKTGALYDPNSTHIWNRLYDALLIREGPTGAKYGADSLDALLWRDTKHLLVQPSHRRALRVLDQFLQTHAENLIQDSLKPAILQRDSQYNRTASLRPIVTLAMLFVLTHRQLLQSGLHRAAA